MRYVPNLSVSKINQLLIFFLLSLSFSCSILPKKRCWKTGYIQHDSTYFPPAQLDYTADEHQVRLAMPTEDHPIRIWVKGSEENLFVRIKSTNGFLKDVTLSPPYYTDVIAIPNVQSDSIHVSFGNEAGTISKSKIQKTLFLKKIRNINSDSTFAFLIYGCVQPFKVDKEGNPLLLNDTGNPLNYEMRQLFEDVGMERKIIYYPENSDSAIHDILITNPVLAIGTGDQVYVDAGYEKTDFRKHALSGWSHSCKDPYPLLDEESYTKHLNRCYGNFYSFRCFENIFSTLPLISVWDDHEIRDGWGSHGDEYSKKTGAMSAYLKPYFNIAKQAYISHQIIPGQEVKDPVELIKNNSSLEQQYEYYGIPIFAFDLRSNRNIHTNAAIDSMQMNAFKAWCKNLKDSSEVILVSSIPFFYKPYMPLKILARIFQPGLRDDINDGWYSKYNERQRNEIMQELINLRNRNIKPVILSGDAHLGGLISAWYSAPDGDRKRLCYELIYSGLTHEALGEERQGFIIQLRKRSEGRKKKDPTFPVGDYHVDYIYEFIQGRLNFGALQFAREKRTIASLFIVDDNEKYLTKRDLELNWDETYEEYLKRAEPVTDKILNPPKLTMHRILRAR